MPPARNSVLKPRPAVDRERTRRACSGEVSSQGRGGKYNLAAAEVPTAPDRNRATKRSSMYKLLSFDVYGTLINTPLINVKAFRLILEQAGASNIDASAF